MMWDIQRAAMIATGIMLLFVLAVGAWAEQWTGLERPPIWVLVLVFLQGAALLFVQFVNFVAAWRTLTQYEKANAQQLRGGGK